MENVFPRFPALYFDRAAQPSEEPCRHPKGGTVSWPVERGFGGFELSLVVDKITRMQFTVRCIFGFSASAGWQETLCDPGTQTTGSSLSRT